MIELPKTQKCTSCGRYRKLKYFGDDRRGKYGKKRQCNKCKRISSKSYRKRKRKSKDLNYYAYIILANMRKKHKMLNLSVDPEFTKGDIVKILKNGRCAVTNRSFCVHHNTKYRSNPFMASPDRIDNSKGYFKDNVRWVMVWVNKARQEYDIEFFVELMKGVRWK